MVVIPPTVQQASRHRLRAPVCRPSRPSYLVRDAPVRELSTPLSWRVVTVGVVKPPVSIPSATTPPATWCVCDRVALPDGTGRGHDQVRDILVGQWPRLVPASVARQMPCCGVGSVRALVLFLHSGLCVRTVMTHDAFVR
jgi:hypothetical protein